MKEPGGRQNNAGQTTMKPSLHALVLGLGLSLAIWPSWAEPCVVAPGAKVEKLAGDFQLEKRRRRWLNPGK